VKETTNANIIKVTVYAKMRATVYQQTTTMENGTTINKIQMKNLYYVIKNHNQFIKTSTHLRIYPTIAKRFKS
jgi:hypothetical protein